MALSTLIFFIITTYVMGFITAIPVGATQFETIRRSIHGFLPAAAMVVAGSVSSDAIYGVIAVFGLAPFIQNPTVVAVFWMVNAAIMIVIGIWSIKSSNSIHGIDLDTKKLINKKSVAYLTGISLATTNPMMIAWWLLGVRITREICNLGKFGTSENVIFLFAGTLGIGSYLLLLAYMTYKAKHFLTQKTIYRISWTFSIVLFGLAIYFIVKSVLIFTDYSKI